ncbi:hypothetical protein [Acinetobacter baumannii]
MQSLCNKASSGQQEQAQIKNNPQVQPQPQQPNTQQPKDHNDQLK